MIKIASARQRIYANAVDAVIEWWPKQCVQPYVHYYLYHRPSGDTRWGHLTIAENRPQGYELSDAERISPAWTQEQAIARIVAISGRLPLLPTGPAADE